MQPHHRIGHEPKLIDDIHNHNPSILTLLTGKDGTTQLYILSSLQTTNFAHMLPDTGKLMIISFNFLKLQLSFSLFVITDNTDWFFNTCFQR